MIVIKSFILKKKNTYHVYYELLTDMSFFNFRNRVTVQWYYVLTTELCCEIYLFIWPESSVETYLMLNEPVETPSSSFHKRGPRCCYLIYLLFIYFLGLLFDFKELFFVKAYIGLWGFSVRVWSIYQSSKSIIFFQYLVLTFLSADHNNTGQGDLNNLSSIIP